MNGLIIKLIILLFVGLALCEVHGFIYWQWPETENIKLDLFLSEKYKEKITVLWYVYELGNIINHAIWAFVLGQVALRISFKLFKVCFVFFGYYSLQILLYMWNRNTSFLTNYILYGAMALILITITTKDKTFNYKSLN